MGKNDLTKAEAAYLYIVKHEQQNPNFGKTLFYKMLYFSDFDHYERFEKSITGSDYRKIENGPAPCIFDKIVASLKEKGYVKQFSNNVGGMRQIRYMLLKEPEFSGLASDEFNQLKMSMKKLEGMTAKQVSSYSHEDMPYKSTKMKDLIDYELVFYRNPQYSVSSR